MGSPARPPASTARKEECSELRLRERRRSRPAKAPDGTCSRRQPVTVSRSRSERLEKAPGSSVLTSSDDRHLMIGKHHVNLDRSNEILGNLKFQIVLNRRTGPSSKMKKQPVRQSVSIF